MITQGVTGNVKPLQYDGLLGTPVATRPAHSLPRKRGRGQAVCSHAAVVLVGG
jgi:hypothetical protein